MLQSVYDKGCPVHAGLALPYLEFRHEVVGRYMRLCATRVAANGLPETLVYQHMLLSKPGRSADLLLCVACTRNTEGAWKRLAEVMTINGQTIDRETSEGETSEVTDFFGYLFGRSPEGAIGDYLGRAPLNFFLASVFRTWRAGQRRAHTRFQLRNRNAGQQLPHSHVIDTTPMLGAEEIEALAIRALLLWNGLRNKHRVALQIRELPEGTDEEAARVAGMSLRAMQRARLRFCKKLLRVLPKDRVAAMDDEARLDTGLALCSLVVACTHRAVGGGG